MLQKMFQYSLKGEYVALSSEDYATLLSGHDILTYVFTKGHMCQLETDLYPNGKIMCCLYALFINKAKQIKSNFNYWIKPQLNNITYNLKNNLWLTNSLFSEKVQARCLHMTYLVDAQCSWGLW